jgi:membrane protease subunit (stomatin/prohibitin family)
MASSSSTVFLLGLVAGVLIFATSFLVLSVLFPDSIQEMIDGSVAFLESAPIDEETKQAQIAAAQGNTATAQALSGLMGTFATSLVIAAIVGIFLRKKN